MSWPTKKLVEIFKSLLDFLAPHNRGSGIKPLKPSVDVLVSENKKSTEELPAQKIKTTTELEEEQIMTLLKQGKTNPALSEATKLLRKFINCEFGLDFEKDCLQCTEYVQYKVLKELGIKIDWTGRDRRRDGAVWPEIFMKLKRYNVLNEPKKGCAMSFASGCPVPPGHVAFVEEVLTDNSIRISEANWDKKGSYKERTLTEQEWRNYYKSKFIDFF